VYEVPAKFNMLNGCAVKNGSERHIYADQQRSEIILLFLPFLNFMKCEVKDDSYSEKHTFIFRADMQG